MPTRSELVTVGDVSWHGLRIETTFLAAVAYQDLATVAAAPIAAWTALIVVLEVQLQLARLDAQLSAAVTDLELARTAAARVVAARATVVPVVEVSLQCLALNAALVAIVTDLNFVGIAAARVVAALATVVPVVEVGL